MTQWHGIKVGNLYKRTGRGSRSVPLALVVEIEEVVRWNSSAGPIDGVKLVTLEDGKLEYSWLTRSLKGDITVDGDEWPYKERHFRPANNK